MRRVDMTVVDDVVKSLVFMDPEMLMQAIRNTELTPCQLSAHPAPSAIARVMGSGLCLDLATLGPAMLFSGSMPKDCYTLSYVRTCPDLGNSFNFGLVHTDGYLGFFPPGAPLDATTPEGCQTAILTVPIDRFHAAIARDFPEIPDHLLRHGGGMKVGAVEQRILKQLLADVEVGIHNWRDDLSNAPVRERLGRDLLAAYLGALRSGCAMLPPPPPTRVAGRYRRIKQARDFIADHLQESIHLGDLGLEIGLSMRGTENLFKDMIGVNPTIYLRHQRLHAVRRKLAKATPSPGIVKQVALEMGFWHLGRFASDYRAFFGENPSATLARCEHPREIILSSSIPR